MKTECSWAKARPRTRLLIWTGVLSAAIGVFAAFYVNQILEPQATQPTSSLVGQARPDFELYDLNENQVPISTWDGHIVLLNFWATWCPPCRREIPIFNEVRELYQEDGFEVVGIAVDEKKKVIEFLAAMPEVRYPQLVGYQDAMYISQLLGNRTGGLPYSVLLDANGVIRFIKAGELNKATLMAQIKALL